MITLTRTDESVFGRWWWSVDRWQLAFIGALIMFGIVLIQAASPAVAQKHHLPSFHFVQNYVTILLPSLCGMIGLSLLTLRQIRLVAFALFPAALLGVALTLAFGAEIKGATRWLSLGGFALQPSEFLKPAFIIVAAWLFARHCERRGFPSLGTNFVLFLLTIALLVQQPDFGMTILITLTWLCQFFLAGLPLALVGLDALPLPVGGVAAYFLLPHVHDRINRITGPGTGENSQLDIGKHAFRNCGR